MNKANAIRKNCLECAGGSPKEVTLCHIVYCPLWPFRFGYSINDRRFKARMKAAARTDSEQFEEVRKLVSEYLQNMPNSPEKEQIRAVFGGNSEAE